MFNKKNYIKQLVVVTLLVTLLGCLTTKEVEPVSPMPISRQGLVVEVISPSEVMVEANGEYFGKDIQENGSRKALIDARKTALYVLLYGGSDPILSTPQEKADFEVAADFFFDEATMKNYITYEDSKFLKITTIEGGTGKRVTKNFKINKKILIEDLVARRIIIAQDDLTDLIGKPVIMVLPKAVKGQNPLDLFENQEVRHAATVIESYLTARGYDVVVPEQQALVNSMSAAQDQVEGVEADYAYQLALSIGSDVYITFSGKLEDSSYDTKKYALSLSAFETTTSKLLGSETGYSQGRKGEVLVSIEEAMNGAVDTVLSRVTNYWKEDLEDGIQYKVLVSVDSYFDDDQIDDIQMAFMDAVDEISESSKEQVITRGTIDYLVWIDSEKYGNGLKIYGALKKVFAGYGTDGKIGRISINRKLIKLKIEQDY